MVALCHSCEGLRSFLLDNLAAPDTDLLHRNDARHIQAHQSSAAKLVESASQGCDLCMFFLRCSGSLDGKIPLNASTDFPSNLEATKQLYCTFNKFAYKAWYGFYITNSIEKGFVTSPTTFNTGPIEIFRTGASGPQKLRQQRLLHPDSASEQSFEIIASWAENCHETHHNCPQIAEKPLPTRVLDLGPPGSDSVPRLFTSKGQKGTWVALSYCWGSSLPLKATKETLPHLHTGIPLEKLPATFKDAILITRRLGHRYLWIDSLCIVQDSKSDWARESGKMAYVYGESLLTICAVASPDSTYGIFRSANSGRQKIQMQLHEKSHDSDLWLRSERSLANQERSHLESRGWALQEEILAPRVLKYCPDQISWTCRTVHQTERDLEALDERREFFRYPTNDWIQKALFSNLPSTREKLNIQSKESGQRFSMVMEDQGPNWKAMRSFYSLVATYSCQGLSKETDRLPAIAGIAKAIHQLTGFTYRAGIWEQDVILGLCWYRVGESFHSTTYLAPSWSWASSAGSQIGYYIANFESVEAAADTQILEINLIYADNDPYLRVHSGYLKVRGQCCTVQASDETISAGTLDDGTRVEEGRYEVLLIRIAMLQNLKSVISIPTARHIVLVLESTNDLEAEYRRIGLKTLSEDAYSRLEPWRIQTLKII